jgi:hypothetical protein
MDSIGNQTELLSESTAFYDAEMISELINAMLQHTKNSAVSRITAAEVSYIMNQLKASIKSFSCSKLSL